ncbi:uncharacterized protein [Apostichopus japonicus]|uniref:uncharacterized protein isoform X2 n=1 Tax=Stichopus japonicus TaxID=307972 RepID=UPI003AB693ED
MSGQGLTLKPDLQLLTNHMWNLQPVSSVQTHQMRYFFLHTTNEMKWTSCNETWHCRANSYPVIPIYPSNKGYMSCLSMQGHLEVCLDCKDLDGFCESCTEMQGCTTPFPTEEVWQKTGGILHINAKNVLDRKSLDTWTI